MAHPCHIWHESGGYETRHSKCLKIWGFGLAPALLGCPHRSVNRGFVFDHRKRGMELGLMRDSVKRLEDEVSTWPHVSLHPHRFGGREFLFDKAEVGHVHVGGIVDIPFPRSVRDSLLADGLAEEHRWVPNSGWITFKMHGGKEEDLRHAIWIMRLSYLRYALKTASD